MAPEPALPGPMHEVWEANPAPLSALQRGWSARWGYGWPDCRAELLGMRYTLPISANFFMSSEGRSFTVWLWNPISATAMYFAIFYTGYVALSLHEDLVARLTAVAYVLLAAFSIVAAKIKKLRKLGIYTAFLSFLSCPVVYFFLIAAGVVPELTLSLLPTKRWIFSASCAQACNLCWSGWGH